MAINGALECKGPYKVKAFKRFTIYVKVLNAFKLNDVKPLQEGCYPISGAESSDFRLCNAVGAHKNSAGMYHWCNDNCNSEDPNCPDDMCSCEGGNPVKKVKQNETSSDRLTQTLPKIQTEVHQNLQTNVETTVPKRISPRMPNKPQFIAGKQPIKESEPERNLFRYHQPMRRTTEAPVLSDEIISSTNRPDIQRTRLLRNELGRLIRKRPVVRTQSPLEQ